VGGKVSMNKVVAIVIAYVVGIATILYFCWRIQELLQAISQSSVVEIQSGMAFLLLPLIMPILHIMDVLDKKIASRKIRAIYRKIQGKILLVIFLIILPGVGFVVTQMVMSKIHAEGYQKCEFVTHMTRSIFTSYSKDPVLCPTS